MDPRTSLVVLGSIIVPLFGDESLAADPPGGFPAPEVAQKARDDADYGRAVAAYRFWYPTVSCEGIFHGNREQGLQDNGSIPILSARPHHVGFTLNSDTPYAGGVLDLKGGPYVVELPPGPFIGLANDHHQRWIMDFGIPGPDEGKGGKHLILPPDFRDAVPEGYFVGRSSSYKVLIALRALPAKGDVKAAIDSMRAIRIYPLATAADPKPLPFADMTDKAMDSTPLRWESNLGYWEKLREVIDAEPLVEEYRPMYGLLKALGIEKGKPFAPDERMKGILDRAARGGREQMFASAFDGTRPERMAWGDRKWEWIGLVPDDAGFETPTGLDLEARDRWFAQAIVTSPAMFRRKAGSGSLYWLGHRDSTGAYLDGGKSYKLAVPLPVPAALFWSVTAYDAETRSEVRAPQGKAALGSLFEEALRAPGGSVDLHFGPQPPADPKAPWIQTVPGRGWFAYFRIYGPQGPAFDGAWKPGDFAEVR